MNFSQRQLKLHKQSITILEEYISLQNLAKGCSKAIAEIYLGNNRYLNTKEQFQEAGDNATAKMMDLKIQYDAVLKQLTQPIIFKEAPFIHMPALAEAIMQ